MLDNLEQLLSLFAKDTPALAGPSAAHNAHPAIRSAA